jgi:hypothetical protein
MKVIVYVINEKLEGPRLHCFVLSENIDADRVLPLATSQFVKSSQKDLFPRQLAAVFENTFFRESKQTEQSVEISMKKVEKYHTVIAPKDSSQVSKGVLHHQHIIGPAPMP